MSPRRSESLIAAIGSGGGGGGDGGDGGVKVEVGGEVKLFFAFFFRFGFGFWSGGADERTT